MEKSKMILQVGVFNLSKWKKNVPAKNEMGKIVEANFEIQDVSGTVLNILV